LSRGRYSASSTRYCDATLGTGLLNLPRLFNDGREADAVLDGEFGKKLLAKLPQASLIGLGLWENGFRHPTNSRKPIAKLKAKVLQVTTLTEADMTKMSEKLKPVWTKFSKEFGESA
jgi:TRAP-type C4-dicarboxylate transport system substrate-binding protein